MIRLMLEKLKVAFKSVSFFTSEIIYPIYIYFIKFCIIIQSIQWFGFFFTKMNITVSSSRKTQATDNVQSSIEQMTCRTL